MAATGVRWGVGPSLGRPCSCTSRVARCGECVLGKIGTDGIHRWSPVGRVGRCLQTALAVHVAARIVLRRLIGSISLAVITHAAGLHFNHRGVIDRYAAGASGVDDAAAQRHGRCNEQGNEAVNQTSSAKCHNCSIVRRFAGLARHQQVPGKESTFNGPQGLSGTVIGTGFLRDRLKPRQCAWWKKNSPTSSSRRGAVGLGFVVSSARGIR